MKIFNTLSRRKEEFVPIEPGKVKDVCVRTDRLQFYSYWKCKTDDRI